MCPDGAAIFAWIGLLSATFGLTYARGEDIETYREMRLGYSARQIPDWEQASTKAISSWATSSKRELENGSQCSVAVTPPENPLFLREGAILNGTPSDSGLPQGGSLGAGRV